MVILKHNSLNPEIFFNAIFFPYFSGSMFFRVQVFQSSCFSGSRFFRVQVFQGPGYSGSRLFRVQVFQGPVFLGSRFFRVRVQGPGPGFRSSHKKTHQCDVLLKVLLHLHYSIWSTRILLHLNIKIQWGQEYSVYLSHARKGYF